MRDNIPTSCSDEHLMISLAEEDDLNAFEELLTRYEKSIFNYIYRYTGNYHTSQDIFQETFYRIFKNRKSFNDGSRFPAWAFRIATNLCIDEHRKKTREPETALEDNMLNEDYSIKSKNRRTSLDFSPEEKLVKKDFEEKIKDLVTSLPEKLKSVFILSEYHELPCKEISSVLGIPVGTVKSRLHNGFKQLVELIEKTGLDDELQ
jgi:RNA polymerase sigma-70 factor (ECF subfamily)